MLMRPLDEERPFAHPPRHLRIEPMRSAQLSEEIVVSLRGTRPPGPLGRL